MLKAARELVGDKQVSILRELSPQMILMLARSAHDPFDSTIESFFLGSEADRTVLVGHGLVVTRKESDGMFYHAAGEPLLALASAASVINKYLIRLHQAHPDEIVECLLL